MSTARATHLNPFQGAPRKQGGQNPFLGVLEGLRLAVAGGLSHQTRTRIIDQAEYYAKRNKLSFTRNMQYALKMAEHADANHRAHMAAMEAREKDEFKPELTGFDRASGFER